MPQDLAYPLLPGPSSEFNLPTAAKEKGHPNGRKPQSFLFSSAGESKVIFGPFQYKSDFFFLSQSLVSGRLRAGEWKLALAF